MIQTVRVFLSAVWFVASGTLLASALGFLVTWGDNYGELLVGSILVVAVSTGLVVALSAIE